MHATPESLEPEIVWIFPSHTTVTFNEALATTGSYEAAGHCLG